MHYKRIKREEARVASGQGNFSLPSWATAADIAYAAGYIDADGSITLVTAKSGSTRHGITFYPHISAVSIDKVSVEFLQKLFGGKVNERAPRSTNVRSFHPIHTWYVSGQRSGWIAGVLAPYLKIKAEQARAVHSFYYERTWQQNLVESNVMPETEFQRRLQLVAKVRSRNQREYLPTAIYASAPSQ